MSSVPYLTRGSLTAIVGGLVVAGGLFAYNALAPAEYSGRMTLIATPVTPGPDQLGSSAQFGEVVSLSLPALADLAQSSSVLEEVAAALPQGPTAAEIMDDVSVELVPGSGVVRVAVNGSNRQEAGIFAETLGHQLVGADILAPVGELRLLDDEAEINRVQPDLRLTAGLSSVAGVLTGVAILGIVSLRRQRDGQHSTRPSEMRQSGAQRPGTTEDDSSSLPV